MDECLDRANTYTQRFCSFFVRGFRGIFANLNVSLQGIEDQFFPPANVFLAQDRHRMI